jgi:hypothetical protein
LAELSDHFGEYQLEQRRDLSVQAGTEGANQPKLMTKTGIIYG